MSFPKANKELGQHFLRDQNVINKITEDYKDEAKNIIEVGPGPGVLSQKLADLRLPFMLIEKDERFEEQLGPMLHKDCALIFDDATKAPWSELVAGKEDIWLVSNLPYNVSSVLFVEFLKHPQIQYMTLMFQKEVGEKTYQRDIKNEMNSLLALSLTYFESKKLMLVAPGAFAPPPKVQSIVVSYKRRESPIVSLSEFKTFEKFLRLVFSQKRKQLKSILKGTYPQIAQTLSDCNINETIRAEALSIEEIHILFKKLN